MIVKLIAAIWTISVPTLNFIVVIIVSSICNSGAQQRSFSNIWLHLNCVRSTFVEFFVCPFRTLVFFVLYSNFRSLLFICLRASELNWFICTDLWSSFHIYLWNFLIPMKYFSSSYVHFMLAHYFTTVGVHSRYILIFISVYLHRRFFSS